MQNKDAAVCFLIVNYIKFLPSLSIGSCLAATKSPIVIGYVNEDDLRDLPTSSRIKRIDLRNLPRCQHIFANFQTGAYREFGTNDFFYLVQLKWHLIAELMSLGYQRIIYSDIDTIWLQDAVELTSLIGEHSLLQIQDGTLDITTPRLCMGFASMVNCPEIIQMLEDCALENMHQLRTGDQVGDDDIISEYFLNQGYPSWIRLLPQLAFPTGNMLTQYLAKSAYRDIKPPRPVVFHANYMIGQNNKAIVLERARKLLKVPTQIRLRNHEKLLLSFNYFIVQLKSKLRGILRKFR